MIPTTIINRLQELSKLAQEEDDDGSIKQESQDLFLQFIELRSDFNEPFISLTPDNTVYAAWDTFSIHFGSPDIVHIVYHDFSKSKWIVDHMTYNTFRLVTGIEKKGLPW